MTRTRALTHAWVTQYLWLIDQVARYDRYLFGPQLAIMRDPRRPRWERVLAPMLGPFLTVTRDTHRSHRERVAGVQTDWLDRE